MVTFNNISPEQKKVALRSLLLAAEQQLIAYALRSGLVPEEIVLAEYMENVPSPDDDPVANSLCMAVSDYKKFSSHMGENYEMYIPSDDFDNRQSAVMEGISQLELDVYSEALRQDFVPEEMTFDFQSDSESHAVLIQRLGYLKKALAYQANLS